MGVREYNISKEGWGNGPKTTEEAKLVVEAYLKYSAEKAKTEERKPEEETRERWSLRGK